jgi:hypothetical protein
MDDEARRKDLDETRRLLYMAKAASRTDKYELVGTLVNALKHHQGSSEPAEVIMDRLIRIVEGKPVPDGLLAFFPEA